MKRTWMMLGAASVMVSGCDSLRFGNVDVSDNPPSQQQVPYPDSSEQPPPDGFPAAPPNNGAMPSFTYAHLADAPPAISGGTLLVTSDGDHVVAADPDRDRLYVASIAQKSLVATLKLAAHDEPGRLAEDDAHRVHVALRRGGAVVTIDPTLGTILGRRDVCPSPRGITFDSAGARMIVACEGGELVAVPTDPAGTPALIARLDRDLRDVVIAGGHMYVSRFRSAEILDVSPEGTVLARSTPDVSKVDAAAKPTLAWRMIAAPPGAASTRPVLLHEIAATPGGTPVSTTQGGYGSPPLSPTDCAPTIITAAVSLGDGSLVHAPTQLVVPVDIATDGVSYAVVAAGNGHTPVLPQIYILGTSSGPCADTQNTLSPSGQAIAVALLPGGLVLVQSREPAQLEIIASTSRVNSLGSSIIPLASDSREDTGHAIFHSNSGSGIACASCHGEGGDDGHVWTFDTEGARRTPSLRGTLAGTAPYHWNGEMADISVLADTVMTGRMNGPPLDVPMKQDLESWLFALPALPAPTGLDPAAIARGRAIFESKAAGCASCHGGVRFTSSDTLDVGTGGLFQVPSLVGVSARAPFLHNGCAATLTDRFGACGGGAHGNTSSLSPDGIGDLVTYLQSL